MANPNPARITDPMWRMWTDAQPLIPGVRLGGIYAFKRCYHGTRTDNQRNWPGAYCVRLSLDLQGPPDKAAAIDYTMSDTEMRKRTGYLRASALDPTDDRLAALREFYGTLNSRDVYGLIKDSRSGSWRSSTADATHLWHIHLSVFRAYVTAWTELAPVLSVLAGETLAQWRARRKGMSMLCTYGEQGPVVEAMQRLVLAAGGRLPRYGPDGDYGDETAAGLKAIVGGDGRTYGPAQYVALHVAVARRYAGATGPAGPPGPKGDRGPAGPAGRTPTKIAISGDVIAVE